MKNSFIVLLIMILIIVVIAIMLILIPTKFEHTNKIKVIYQPMQCVSSPWNNFDGNINDNNIMEDSKIIINYFQKKEILISNLEKNYTDDVVCQACEICPENYFYTLEIYAKDLAFLKDLGFEQI